MLVVHKLANCDDGLHYEGAILLIAYSAISHYFLQAIDYIVRSVPH